MTSDNYSKAQLIDALIAAYRNHKDEGVWDTDETEDEYVHRLNQSSMEQLIEETCTDEEFSLEEFFYAYS